MNGDVNGPTGKQALDPGVRIALGLLLAAAALPALAQSVSVKVNSFWSLTEDQKHSFAATLLRKNATTGNLEAIPGQRIALEQMKIVYGATLLVPVRMIAVFPGQKSSAMTVAGVRLFHTGAGTGWDMPEHPANVALPTLTVPSGQKVTCVYNMPIRTMGDVTCSVGVVAAASPPTTGSVSPNGTKIPPALEIVDAAGKWTLGSVTSGKRRQILLNGKVVGDHAETLEKSVKGIFAWNSNNGYSMWNGTAWVGGTP